MKKVKTIISEEALRNYASKQGWFDKILHKSISFSINKDKMPSNMLAVTRKVFNNYYVEKRSYNGSWIFTIYCGDKETMKFLHSPIKFETPRQQFNREFKKDMEMLKEHVEQTKQKDRTIS